MKRTGWGVFLLALGVATADEGREVRVTARGAWPHLPTHSSAGVGTDRAPITRVIRSADELARAAGGGALVTTAKAFQLPALDFDKHMILAVEDGTQPMVGTSGGAPPSAPYTVSIIRVDRDPAGGKLTVHWRRLPRAADQVLTRPLEAALIERSTGEVTFNRLPDPPAKADPPAPAGSAVVLVGRALWPNGWPPEEARKEWTVRSEAELIDPRLRAPEPVLERMRAEAKARYAKALGVADIDFSKQMLVGVSAGVQPAGARVEITSAAADAAGKTLTVSWRLYPAGKDAPGGTIAHPAGVALVDRFTGDVRFQQERR